MNQPDIQRLAAAVNALRPDWPTKSLTTFIAKHLGDRATLDAVVAMAWIAADPKTQTPARVLASGPWWQATRPAGEIGAPQPNPMHAAEICRVCRKNRAGHDHMTAISGDGHAFTIKPPDASHSHKKWPRTPRQPEPEHTHTPGTENVSERHTA